MSRSRKKAIIKDKPRNYKASAFYWRRIRSRLKNILKSCKNFENLELPNPKTLISDYDYCDYSIDYEYRTQIYQNYTEEDFLEDKTKFKRK